MLGTYTYIYIYQHIWCVHVGDVNVLLHGTVCGWDPWPLHSNNDNVSVLPPRVSVCDPTHIIGCVGNGVHS